MAGAGEAPEVTGARRGSEQGAGPADTKTARLATWAAAGTAAAGIGPDTAAAAAADSAADNDSRKALRRTGLPGCATLAEAEGGDVAGSVGPS